jgi:hypothetical protein
MVGDRRKTIGCCALRLPSEIIEAVLMVRQE